MQRVQHFLAFDVPAFGAATYESVPVHLWKSHSLKTCAVVQEGIIGSATSMSFPSCMCPIGDRIANVSPTLRYSSLQQLGSCPILFCAGPLSSQGRSLHVSVAFRQKSAVQRAAAWGERPSAGKTGRPNAPGAPSRRPAHKKRRGPITERRSAPRSQYGAGEDYAPQHGLKCNMPRTDELLTNYTACSVKCAIK